MEFVRARSVITSTINDSVGMLRKAIESLTEGFPLGFLGVVLYGSSSPGLSGTSEAGP